MVKFSVIGGDIGRPVIPRVRYSDDERFASL
jgi:hypothetical protein